LPCNCSIIGHKLIRSVSGKGLMHTDMPFVKPNGKSEMNMFGLRKGKK
jgi:hypothetical protein